MTAKDGTIVTHGLSSIGVRGLKHSGSLGDGDVTVAGDNITVTTGGNLSIGMEARVEDSKSGRGQRFGFRPQRGGDRDLGHKGTWRSSLQSGPG
ncbi:hypothetical protein Q1M63_23420 [Sinorhizobium meliloti]|nr:hypothetical protein Q1M63_23420 [Sinorhizobium meliloti]